MRKTKGNLRAWLAAGAVLVLLGAGGASTAETAAGEKAKVLIAQLGHEEYAQREAALKALIALGDTAVPLLQEALKSDNPEVRLRAQTALDEIEANKIAFAFDHPKKASFELKGKTTEEILAEINKSFSGSLEMRNPPEEKLDFQLPEATFWEAVEALRKEAKLRYYNDWDSGGPVVKLYRERAEDGRPSAGNAWRLIAFLKPAICGPVLVLPWQFGANHNVDFFSGMVHLNASLTLGFVVEANCSVHGLGRIKNLTITDDTGRNLGLQEARTHRDDPDWVHYDGRGVSGTKSSCRMFQQQLQFLAPDGGAASISLSGEVEVLLPAKVVTVTFDDLGKDAGKKVTVGGYTLSFVGITEINGQSSPTFKITGGRWKDVVLRESFLDTKGKELPAYSSREESDGNTEIRSYQFQQGGGELAKIVIEVGEKWVRRHVRFDLPRIPLR